MKVYIVIAQYACDPIKLVTLQQELAEQVLKSFDNDVDGVLKIIECEVL